ncbi:MAG TPA: hypothetical protein PLB62_09450, partial [Candidatus Sumerlaeota bacterium]|nr:hypothetical protein [Candidatus Sumerlaeota bacterium]
AAGERGQSPLVFSFVFWGFALRVKWSILGMGIVPFFVLLVPAGLYFHHTQSGRGASIKSMARPVLKWWLLGMVIVAAVFSPWMIRAFLQTGNPVFPFLSGVFPWDGWTRAQMDYYMDVNRQAAPFSSEHLGMYLHKWKDLGALWFLPALLSPFFIRERRSNLILLVFGLAGYLLWNLFLQPPARFLVPLIPVFVLLNLVTFRGLVRSTPRGVFFLFPWILLVPALLYVRLLELHNSGFLKAALFSYQQEEFLQEQLPAYYEAADFINKNLPADARLLFLYEARVFYVERPVTASTVFDRSPLVNHAAASESARDLMKRLQGAGYTHILLNEVEMNRLIRTYVPKSILIGMGIAPYFTNPDANLTAFDNLYGPYLLDPGYEKARPVIREFTRIMKTRAVFDRVDDRGLRFFIAPLAD